MDIYFFPIVAFFLFLTTAIAKTQTRNKFAKNRSTDSADAPHNKTIMMITAWYSGSHHTNNNDDDDHNDHFVVVISSQVFGMFFPRFNSIFSTRFCVHGEFIFLYKIFISIVCLLVFIQRNRFWSLKRNSPTETESWWSWKWISLNRTCFLF